MPTFVWTGRSRDGQSLQGEMEAQSREEVVAAIRGQQILVTSVRPKSKGLSLSFSLSLGGGRVREKDLVVFTRQFATMINAGLPLVQCLDILARQTPNRAFAQVIDQVRQDVEAGSTLADALKKHPKVFDALYVNMVTAGEVGGVLDTILNRLSGYIEKSMKLKKQIRSALVYPAVILTVAVVVILVLLVWVIPMFSQMFQDFGQELPAMTQMVVQTSYFVQERILWILGAIILAGVVLVRVYRTPGGRRMLDQWFLRLPVAGMLIRKVAVAKFTRTLGTLISSGVPILEGLEIVARTAGNKIVEEAIFKAREAISQGKTLSEPLGKAQIFPPMVIQMVAVGETTGSLDTMLGKIADFYDEEVDATVGSLTSLLEPFLMVFLGGVIGFIVVSMYLPIFKMAGAVG